MISAKSGMVSKAEGEVYVGDKEIVESQTNFPDIKENAVLRTGHGRAEILLTNGVAMRVGEDASFKMLTNRLIDTRLEILTGSALIEATEIVKDNNLTILAGEATVGIAKHGLYRFDMATNSIKVFDGTASVTINGQTMLVGQGRMLKVENGQPVIEKFNKDETDALDNWSRRRAEQVARANASSAKQVYDSGCGPYNTNGRYNRTNWATANPNTTNPTDPCYNPCGGWRYNPWFGTVTYIPCGSEYLQPVRLSLLGAVQRDARLLHAATTSRICRSADTTAATISRPWDPPRADTRAPCRVRRPHRVGNSAPAAAASTGTTSSSSAGSSSAGHGASGGHGK